MDILGVISAIQTDQPRLVSDVKYVTKTSRLDRGVTSRVFSKVLICSRETKALRFDGEIPLAVNDFQQLLNNLLDTFWRLKSLPKYLFLFYFCGRLSLKRTLVLKTYTPVPNNCCGVRCTN